MPSFGEELRRERELRQISLREISEATKINIRYLEALERNDFRHLPGGVFNKGFVRAYAQFIGADPEVMVNSYLLEEQGQTGQEPNRDSDLLRGNLRDRTDGERRDDRKFSPLRIVLLTGAILVLAAVIVLIVWKFRSRDTTETATEPVTAAVPSGVEGAPGGTLSEAEDPPEAEAVQEEGATETVVDPEPEIPAEPDPTPVATVSGQNATRIVATVVLDRETRGRLNCDNRQVTILQGRPAGTTFRFECDNFLLVNADDGGAIRIGLGDREPAPIGPEGSPVRGYRIVPSSMNAGDASSEQGDLH